MNNGAEWVGGYCCWVRVLGISIFLSSPTSLLSFIYKFDRGDLQPLDQCTVARRPLPVTAGAASGAATGARTAHGVGAIMLSPGSSAPASARGREETARPPPIEGSRSSYCAISSGSANTSSGTPNTSAKTEPGAPSSEAASSSRKAWGGGGGGGGGQVAVMKAGA